MRIFLKLKGEKRKRKRKRSMQISLLGCATNDKSTMRKESDEWQSRSGRFRKLLILNG